MRFQNFKVRVLRCGAAAVFRPGTSEFTFIRHYQHACQEKHQSSSSHERLLAVSMGHISVQTPTLFVG